MCKLKRILIESPDDIYEDEYTGYLVETDIHSQIIDILEKNDKSETHKKVMKQWNK